MHHIYPTAVKGDPLCPLGFHPQVRWPTRCKRCFRDYKEHGGRKKEEESTSTLRRDDVTISSPSLSSWNSASSRSRDNSREQTDNSRNWASSTSLATTDPPEKRLTVSFEETNRTPASWTSTPDLANINVNTHPVVSYNLTLPKRRPPPTDTGQEVVIKRPDLTIKKTDSLAERVKKMQAQKNSKSESTNTTRIKPDDNKEDLQFLMQVKSKTPLKSRNSVDRMSPRRSLIEEDNLSIADTDTTDTTLVGPDTDYLEQIESLKQELEQVKTRCERAEREKSDILLRRLASYETTSNKTTATEVLKLQEKVNELQSQNEDLRSNKKTLTSKVKELEQEIENKRSSAEKRVVDELQAKLTAAETLCEELMDENEDIKKELRNMEEEIEEMQDNFREDQADEYTSLKKELEQTSKNCRILSFKLRKAERKTDELEASKREIEQKLQEVAGENVINQVERIKFLEQELKLSTEVSIRLQKELQETNDKLSKVEGNKKKAPMLASIGKSNSGEGKVSRETLTRGGSQDDPVQLLRDLQDSIEREADLREQLRFAEEEAQNLRRKTSRIEDDNESLVLQLKKMATKARSRKLSPTSHHLSPDLSASSIDKDEGISDVEDPQELKLLLELNEQEAVVLRRKVEDLEAENELLNKKVKDSNEKKNFPKNTPVNLVSSGKVTTLDTKKIKVLESELTTLRKKLIEKERDCERLHAELTLTQKQKQKGVLLKSKSLDGDQQAIDLKRQMEVIEQETQVLHNKIKSLESDNEKLMIENKKLQLLSGTKKIGADKSLDRIAKLEVELAEAKKTTTEKPSKKLKEDFDKLKEQLSAVEAEKLELTEKINEFKSSAVKLKPRTPKKPTEYTTKLQLQKMVTELENEISELLIHHKKSEDLKSENGSEVKEDEQVKVLTNKLSELELKYTEIEKKKNLLDKDKEKLQDENILLMDRIKELNQEIKKAQSKSKDMDKVTSDVKSLVTLLKKDIETRDNEIEKLKKNLTKSDQDKAKLNQTVDQKTKEIKELETKSKLLEDKIKEKQNQIEKLEQNVSSKGENENPQLEKLTAEINDLKEKLVTEQKSKVTLQENLTKIKNDLEVAQQKTTTLDAEIKLQKEQNSKAKLNQDKMIKLKDSEISKLEGKIKLLEQTTGIRNKQITDTVKKEYEEQISKLKVELEEEKQEYEDLTAKYELLEEEHVVTKAHLVAEKETLNRQLQETELGLENVSTDLKQLRDTYTNKTDTWLKEKSSLLEKLKQYESTSSDTLTIERNRFRATLNEKNSEIEKIKKESDVLKDQLSFSRQQQDELRKKLDDFDKVSKIQRNMNADTTALEKEIRQLTNRCQSIEKSHKIEMTQCKMRYDNQLQLLNDELQSLQDQNTRFKRERDNFKHMLESAQRTMVDLKTGTKTQDQRLSVIDDEETKTKIMTLEQQVSCMEDELSEARLEGSKLKTELVSERSNWEIKLSELQTRVNELEEERIIASGRSKIPGLRTRMELAWQKEREEQQRLLQETSTLARDLRQTLFEVERERDKERLESKRKQDQLKKFVEEEQEENKKKLSDIQCDLLELRDAHAKLRTTNEKLRREKERHEREYDELRSAALARRRADLEEDRKLSSLLEQFEELIKLVPELSNENQSDSNSLLAMTPTAPRRMKGPKSRESSPSLDRRSISREPSPSRARTTQSQIQSTLQRLTEATEELRRYQKLGDAEREKERAKRLGIRRAASTETENVAESTRSILVNKRNGFGDKSLKRRSLSLEQTAGNRTDQVIWKTDDDSISSLQSLDGNQSSLRYLQDSSLDSRLSGGSTQSEIINTGNMPKKKKGLIGKLKKLTKSHSIDEQIEQSPAHQGSDSDMSMSEDIRTSSKTNLKGRITGMFKRSGSSSRSNSLERSRKDITSETISMQRPLQKNDSSSQLSKKSDESSTSKLNKIKKK